MTDTAFLRSGNAKDGGRRHFFVELLRVSNVYIKVEASARNALRVGARVERLLTPKQAGC
jgi:hypothetical protein